MNTQQQINLMLMAVIMGCMLMAVFLTVILTFAGILLGTAITFYAGRYFQEYVRGIEKRDR